MRHSMRLLTFALALPACASAEPEVQSVAAGNHVIVEQTALQPAVGAYRLAEVEDFAPRDAGSMARYAPRDSLATHLPRLDVFVYPAHHAVEAETGIAQRGLMEYDRRSPAIARTRVDDEGWFPLADGDSAYKATLYMEVQGRPSRSLLYLHRVGDRFLKVRTTFPLPLGPNPDPVIDATVEALFGSATRATPMPRS